LRGRKNLVWVSGSFPFDLGNEKLDLDWANDTGQSFSREIERAAQALTDAGIAVYPVDARGLMGNGVTAAGDYSEAPHPEFADGDEHLPTRVSPGNLESMKVLAERTGGKAFYGSNINVDLRLDPHDIHLEQNNGLWTGTLQTVFLQLNSRGEIIHVLDESLELTLPQNVYEQALNYGLKNTKHIRILPGAAQLCVVLRNSSNGNIGSLSVPLAKYLPAPGTPLRPQ
jgi:hypothetical protein